MTVILPILIIALPLLAAAVALASERLGKTVCLPACCVCICASAAAAVGLLLEVGGGNHMGIIPLGPWIEAGPFVVDWALRVDSLSVLMMAMVTVVSAAVHVYSLGYMRGESGQPRFFFALGLFTFAMLVLASAENLLQLFLGWEGVGFCSYLLIGFWWRKPLANRAAVKAFIMNRIGDVGMILAMVILFILFGSLDFTTLFSLFPIHSGMEIASAPAYEVVALLLFFGAMGKSAQLGLHTWLADAMEGPTPVSALIHAATMVTAGVFLLVRLSPLLVFTPFALDVILTVGVATALFAAVVATAQNDIKRVIAWSTCSQLGYMFAAVGATAWGAAMFHMITHAFFKALLFLAAGAVIHAGGEQDIRKLGGLRGKMPFTAILFIIAAASLTGVPFLGGYYSKDFILETLAATSSAAVTLGLLAAVATAFYSYRLVRGIFYGEQKAAARRAHETERVMGLPMFALALGAIFGGYGFYELLVGNSQRDFWANSVEVISQSLVFHEAHKFAPIILPSALAAIALGLALHMSRRFLRDKPGFARLAAAAGGGFGFDRLYHRLLVVPYGHLSINLWRLADVSVLQKQWVEGTASRALSFGGAMASAHDGKLHRYASVILIAFTFAALWVSFAN